MTEKVRSPLAVSILLSVLSFALFMNTLDNKPTNWDDPALFSRTTIHAFNAENLKQVLTYHAGSTYQPVRDISYMIDFSLWGNQVVYGMHLQNIILYILMVLACYLFLYELLSVFVEDASKRYVWASLSAVLFAVHPVHVESVAWLFARKQPLLGLFTFLSLWAFIKGRTVSWKYLVLSVLCLMLAILSQPIALVIPGVMILLDLAIQGRLHDPSFWKKRLILYATVFVIVVPMIIRLVTMMHSVGGIKPYHGGSFWTNLLAVSQILMSYIRLIGFTVFFSADYPIRLYTDPATWQPWIYLGLNLLFISSAVYAYRKRYFLYSFFVGWYYLFLLPVSHIYPISQILSDRYAMLPSLSWCVLLGFLLAKLWHLQPYRYLSKDFFMAVSIVLFCSITLVYSYITFRQNDFWQNSQILWENTVARYPNSSPGNVNLAAIYIGQGRYEEAQRLCINAIRSLPYDYLAVNNLALCQTMLKQYDSAIHNYRQALRLKPNMTEAFLGLAQAYFLSGDYQHAYEMYSMIYHTRLPGNPKLVAMVPYKLGYSAWKIGKTEEARKYLSMAEPGARKDKHSLSDLAGVYTSMRDMPKAYELYSALYPMLDDGQDKDTLKMLLDALKARLDKGKSGSKTGMETPPLPRITWENLKKNPSE
jgi:tetratricopeptide (TPR) repeat protein